MGQNAEKIIFVARNSHKYVAKEGGRNLICCRAPHGARGLKRDDERHNIDQRGSRPARGAWIETLLSHTAPETRQSRPARGAWIETKKPTIKNMVKVVAPPTGRVD